MEQEVALLRSHVAKEYNFFAPGVASFNYSVCW
jgi:hypothetical protein